MRTLVMGAATSGAAAARLARRLGHGVTVFDERPDAALSLIGEGFSVVSGAWDPMLLEGIDLVVTSPGFPQRSLPIVETLERGTALISELEFGWRHLHAPTIAVTGTNGKTTVTGLISEMLTRSGLTAPALGNIGEAVAGAVGRHVDVAVVEASSFQLRFVEAFHAKVAVVTNVAPDHLDWHGSFENYLSAKARIVENQDESDLCVYDENDAGAGRLAGLAPGETVAVSGVGVSVDGIGPDAGSGLLHLGVAVMPLGELQVSDPAFLVDLELAAVAALAGGADIDSVIEVAGEFRPGEHRRQVVGMHGGVTFVDDSKATNPHAAVAAIRAFPSVVLIAGGLAKGLDLEPLAVEPNVKAVVAIGAAAPQLLQAAGDRGQAASSMEQAVRFAADAAEPGDTVLLAPGCASFDMFESYGARGSAFSEAVAAIMAGTPS
jgi:UDP-N-acetylmuramoylalanine--D-glutamate ligase